MDEKDILILDGPDAFPTYDARPPEERDTIEIEIVDEA